ncbi:hypothetical protein NFI96_033232 [Prochilodus magdalenae]|nr:hypothetical protein NFI96_033232 [Prochilodus magdalenae]
MDATNMSLHPSCRQLPPLAIDIILQLDLFGIILYSVLTFMATVSMLIYLEECIYIYKNVASNKKSAIIWVNGAAPVIGTMSCLGMWIPRATMFTDMTSATYFAIVVFKFLILMIEECGGDDAFLKRSAKKTFRISTGPCCCCCPCLPPVAVNRRNLFLLKLGSFQFAILKVIFTILSIVLWTNGNYDVADVRKDPVSVSSKYGDNKQTEFLPPVLLVLRIDGMDRRSCWSVRVNKTSDHNAV